MNRPVLHLACQTDYRDITQEISDLLLTSLSKDGYESSSISVITETKYSPGGSGSAKRPPSR
jgi:hypothetical protein